MLITTNSSQSCTQASNGSISSYYIHTHGFTVWLFGFVIVRLKPNNVSKISTQLISRILCCVSPEGRLSMFAMFTKQAISRQRSPACFDKTSLKKNTHGVSGANQDWNWFERCEIFELWLDVRMFAPDAIWLMWMEIYQRDRGASLSVNPGNKLPKCFEFLLQISCVYVYLAVLPLACEISNSYMKELWPRKISLHSSSDLWYARCCDATGVSCCQEGSE